jgi:hypothetical protein
MVLRRDQVLIGFLSLVAEAFSTFAIRWWSTKGPFLSERVMVAVSLGPYFLRRETIIVCVRLLLRVR